MIPSAQAKEQEIPHFITEVDKITQYNQKMSKTRAIRSPDIVIPHIVAAPKIPKGIDSIQK